MDVQGFSTSDFFRIDDLLDFSNDELFCSSSSSTAAAAASELLHHLPVSDHTSALHFNAPNLNYSTDFTGDLCVPNDDVAELEWLSKFVDDSFSDYPKNEFSSATVNFQTQASFHGQSRTKRPNNSWTSSGESNTRIARGSKTSSEIYHARKRESSPALAGDRSSSTTSQSVARRCTHCASEKTPQWRTGPSGPKTLCNACGVRYKSGRLVPEYRPAASPTFVLSQHSNSHRKVMELRRQKEMLR